MARPPATAARLRGVAGSAVRDILALTERPGVISFAGGLPEPGLFDTAGLRAAFTSALGDDSGRRSLQYSTTEGDPLLRERIAELLTGRGLPTTADELLITSGSQQALTLAATLLLEPGSAVLVEEPAYLAALQAFKLAGARLVPVACDDEGLIPEALEAAVRRESPVLLYTVPTFQNPTGRTLPAGRRAAIARIAAEQGLWILEDDPYGELRYDGEAVAPIAGHPDVADRVLALSTLSKIVAPGLRIGWVRAPAGVHRSLVIAKQAADLHTSTIDQAASAIWLGDVNLPSHMEHLRSVYRERRDALVGGLEGALPPGSVWNVPGGGMFVWARLPDGWDASVLLTAALARDVAFVPGAPFFCGEPDVATLRLSFTTHSPLEIGEGFRGCAPRGRRRGRGSRRAWRARRAGAVHLYWPLPADHAIHHRSLAPALVGDVLGGPGRAGLGSGVLVRVSSPIRFVRGGAFGQGRGSPVPEPSGARALGRLVGEMVGKADHLCLRERPPGRTERAEGAF